MTYNYRKLSGRIKEVFGTQEKFALAIGSSNRTVSLKMNNRVKFTQTDIEKSCEVLGIPFEQIPVYFFNPEVQRIEHLERERQLGANLTG